MHRGLSEIGRLTAGQLAAAVAARELSPVEIARATLDAIDRLEPDLHAFVTHGGEPLLAAARAAERRARRGGPLPPLLGVPVAIKDMEATSEYPTTFGSLAFRDHRTRADALHVARLRAAGALIVGKTNTPEFALLGETRNRLGPDSCNPWDRERTPGGSSGGSAAAVAAGLVPLATGTDTGGSITIPAAFCGCFGLKPSHRRIPLWPNADEWPLVNDSGPITRSVGDAELALTLMSGPDARDPQSLRTAAPPKPAAEPLRIAFAETLAGLPVEPVCRRAVRDIAALCADLGHAVEEAAPDCSTPAAALERIGAVEERRYRGHLLARQQAELEPETVAFMEDGHHATAHDYAEALAQVRAVQSAFDRFFERHDLLLAPATACPAFPRRQPPTRINGEPVAAHWSTFAPFNLFGNATGGPLASVPAPAQDGQPLPLGVLIFGPVGSDGRVLDLARALEAVSPWAVRRPDLHATREPF